MLRSVKAILSMLVAISFTAGASKIQSTTQPHTTVEIRLAEGSSAPGLTEAAVTGSRTRVYLHREVLMTARDILRCDFSDTSGHFLVGLALTDNAADRMANATSGQDGKLLALLVDGHVIAVSVNNIKRYFRPYCAFDVSSKEEVEKVARIIRIAVIESLMDAHGRLTLEIRLAHRDPGKDLVKSVEAMSQGHVYLFQTPIVSNADIVEAKVVNGYMDGIFNVQLTLTDEAAQRFQQFSDTHKGEMLAEMVGGRVVGAGYILPDIAGRLPARPQISGDFIKEEAELIADAFNRK
jgi:preprotein translocase subunit SecD